MYVLDEQGNVHSIDEASIICIEVSRPHTIYRTLHGNFRAPRTLSEFRKVYEPMSFVQIHKNKLASIQLADKVEDGNIYYSDRCFTISRRIIKKIKSIFDEKHSN